MSADVVKDNYYSAPKLALKLLNLNLDCEQQKSNILSTQIVSQPQHSPNLWLPAIGVHKELIRDFPQKKYECKYCVND